MNEEMKTQVIEINGQKMEVDMRHAKVVHQNLKIGSAVKLLEKSSYGGSEVYQGVIVSFSMFTDQPTITVAYITSSYSNAELKFAHINESDKSKEKWSLVPCVDDELPLNKTDLIASFDRKIEGHHRDIRDIEEKKSYFLNHFDQFFVVEDEALVDA